MGFFEFGKRSKSEAGIRQKAKIEGYVKTDSRKLGQDRQMRFAVPYFDVFDSRFMDYAVPVSVHGTVTYALEDIDFFNSLNYTETFGEESFERKIRATLTKYVKGVVTNIPSEAQIPVMQIERKIMEISDIITEKVTPQVETALGIKIKSIDISSIIVDKESQGYCSLKAVTADLEKENIIAKHQANLNSFKQQNELQMEAMTRQQEMQLGGQEQMQQINLQHQVEMNRIQREEMQRAQRLQTENAFLNVHLADLNNALMEEMSENMAKIQGPAGDVAGMATGNIAANAMEQMMGQATANAGMFNSGMGTVPPMPGSPMGVPPMPGSAPILPQHQYLIGVNGQQTGPFSGVQLREMVQRGQLTPQSYVWCQGMANWQLAGQVADLACLFNEVPSGMPGGMTPPPML